MVVGSDARRRAAAGVEHGGERIDKIFRPGRPTAPPAVFPGRDQVQQASRAIEREPLVRLHVGVMHEQLAVIAESQVVRIAKAAADDLHAAPFGIGADDGAAGSFDADGVTGGIFIAGRHKVPFVIIAVRAGGIDLPVNLGVVAQQDVNQSVGAEDQAMSTMLERFALEFDERAHLFELPFLVQFGEAVKARSIGPFTSDEHIAVEGQNSLAILDFVAVRLDLVRDAVVIAVIDQQQRTPFLGGEDVPEFVEGHGDQRAGLFAGEDLLDLEFIHRFKAFILDEFGCHRRFEIFGGLRCRRGCGSIGCWNVGLGGVRRPRPSDLALVDDGGQIGRFVARSGIDSRGDFIAAVPGGGFTERAEDLSLGPATVVIDGGVPQRQGIGAGLPGVVAGVRDPLGVLFLDGHAGNQGGCLAGAVRDLDGNQIASLGDELGNVVFHEFLGRFPRADAAAVEVQLVGIIRGQRDDRGLRRLDRERLAKMADRAGGDRIFRMLGRPDPLGLLRGRCLIENRRGKRQRAKHTSHAA